ncbi:MAG TPA: cell wall anchor protein [Ignavibacteriales bacterium]|nr:cell wall anchor protein [Ignavibacteriales bacterium]
MFAIKYLSIFLMLVLGVTIFTGCSDEEEIVTPTPAAKSRVLVTHASPDAPGVDLLVDNTVAGTNLTFPNSTGYLEVNSGTRNVKVNVTGTSTTAIEANLNLAADKNYSVFAVNNVASIEAIVLEDDLTSPASGKAHVRFVHLSPNAPAVDITLSDGTVVFGDYTFKEASAFTPLNAGTYDLQVRLAGSSTVVLDLPGISLTTGKIYTVFAKGLVGGAGTQALGAQIIVNK